MSGHSKWKNIMHKKGKTDAQRSAVFAKIGKEITVAVREGGPEVASNSRLRDVIAKAKSNNVPNDNIERIIKKASSAGEGEQYEAITYEGYGPSGVAVIVEALTDNRNRTAGDLRHYFDKCGGNLGQIGCVSFMFEKMGLIVIEDSVDEDKLMETALELGANDFKTEENVFEIYTDPKDFSAVREGLEKAGYEFVSAQTEMIPSTYTSISDEEAVSKMEKLLDLLDENEDVQNVYHNWDD